jgi:hypothetical protein
MNTASVPNTIVLLMTRSRSYRRYFSTATAIGIGISENRASEYLPFPKMTTIEITTAAMTTVTV